MTVSSKSNFSSTWESRPSQDLHLVRRCVFSLLCSSSLPSVCELFSLSLFFSRRFFSFLVSVSVRMSAILSKSLRFIGHFEPKKVLV